MKDASKVRFAWRYGAEPRHGIYPEEEGDRTVPFSDQYWSEVETLPQERIEEIRWARLQNLLRFVEEQSPFYRQHWQEAGIRASDVRSWADFRRLPVITKEDFQVDQEAFPPYGNACTSPPHTMLKHWQTSGTTGKPRFWCDSREDWDNGVWMQTRGLYAHGVRSGWRAFISFTYPPAIGFWICHEAAEALGCQVVPRGPMPTNAWLLYMKELAVSGAPTMVAGTPTSMVRMIEVAEAEGIDLRSLNVRILHMAGEPGPTIPATKKFLEEAWGAKAHDMLGTTETSGPLFYSCATQAEQAEMNVHFAHDQFIMELVDPKTLQPVPEGEQGVTVVTSLSRFGKPAVRFMVGDVAALARERCGCGRTLPLIHKGAISRVDNLLMVKGVKFYPSMIENAVRAVDGLAAEYLIEVYRAGAVGVGAKVMVEAREGIATTDYQQLARQLQADIKLKTMATLDVEVQPPGSLPREQAKSKRIVERS